MPGRLESERPSRTERERFDRLWHGGAPSQGGEMGGRVGKKPKVGLHEGGEGSY